MIIEFITLGAFLLLLALFYFVRSLVLGWRGSIDEQLAADALASQDSGPIFGEATEALAAQMPTLLVTDDQLTQELRRAGYYKPTARSEFLALRNVLAFLVVVLTGVYAVMVGPARRNLTAPILIWGGAIAVVVYLLPWLVLRLQARRRVNLIRRSLPDAFDMLTMCLSGGLGLQDALGHVSREIYFSHPDLALELEIVRRHADLASLGDGFRQFAKRIDAPEVVNLAALVSQTERLGTNVVQAVRDFADGVRLKQRQSADERASKAGIKLLFPLVLCLAPSALIILWGPALLELRNFFRSPDLNNDAAVGRP